MKELLEEMFTLQKELIKPYIGIEGLPEYPIDINTKENQTLLKDFGARYLEELAEAHEVYLEMFDKVMLAQRGNYDFRGLVSSYNEEIADSLHFLLELLIYSNIDNTDIYNYYSSLYKELNLDDIPLNEEPLEISLKYGRICNIDRGINPRTLIGYTVYYEHELTMKGGNVVGTEFLAEMEKQLWDITYHLQLLRNCLKNKPWKQTEVETDENKYQLQLMEVWLHSMRFFDLMGFKSENLHAIYVAKNKKNQERIKNKY